MHSLDLVVILLYFALTLGIGMWSSRRQDNAGDYFLGARDLPAWAVMLSIVATETSALTVVSVPGIGARGDLTFLQLSFGYLLGRIAVAAWLLPGYFRGEQDTAYQRIERRFGLPARQTVSLVFLVTRFLGDAVRVFAGAVPLSLVTGWSMPAAILVIGLVTLVYTWFGGLKAVVWSDVLQLMVYVAGGIAALFIATRLAGGWDAMLATAGAAGKLKVVNPVLSLTMPYTLLGGLLGGGLISAASHGTDHLIVQRLLGTRSLGDARKALIGSGVVIIAQFALFLLVGTAIWAAQLAPDGMLGDAIFSSFIVHQLPAGFSGLVIAGILAAAMSTHSSAISALASSLTYDIYVTRTGRKDPAHLLRIGRAFSLAWGLALIGGALAFHYFSSGRDTPAVVLALSIASVTYGALLGTYVLGGRWARANGNDVITSVILTVLLMLTVVFASRLSVLAGLGWLGPVGRLAWPWYVPVGTFIAITSGVLLSLRHPPPAEVSA